MHDAFFIFLIYLCQLLLSFLSILKLSSCVFILSFYQSVSVMKQVLQNVIINKMLDFKFCIMTAIFSISTQLKIIETVLKAHIIIRNNIDINIRFIYIILKHLYNNLVFISINQSFFRDNSDNILIENTEQDFSD